MYVTLRYGILSAAGNSRSCVCVCVRVCTLGIKEKTTQTTECAIHTSTCEREG